MYVLATRDVSEAVLLTLRDSLQDELDLHVLEGRVTLLSLEPPSWVNLFAKPEWWQVGLTAVAAVYVGELTKEAAKATWKGVAKAASKLAGSSTKLAKLAKSLLLFRSRLSDRTVVAVSLPEPNEYFGARLDLRKVCTKHRHLC